MSTFGGLLIFIVVGGILIFAAFFFDLARRRNVDPSDDPKTYIISELDKVIDRRGWSEFTTVRPCQGYEGKYTLDVAFLDNLDGNGSPFKCIDAVSINAEKVERECLVEEGCTTKEGVKVSKGDKEELYEECNIVFCKERVILLTANWDDESTEQKCITVNDNNSALNLEPCDRNNTNQLFLLDRNNIYDHYRYRKFNRENKDKQCLAAEVSNGSIRLDECINRNWLLQPSGPKIVNSTFLTDINQSIYYLPANSDTFFPDFDDILGTGGKIMLSMDEDQSIPILTELKVDSGNISYVDVGDNGVNPVNENIFETEKFINFNNFNMFDIYADSERNICEMGEQINTVIDPTINTNKVQILNYEIFNYLLTVDPDSISPTTDNLPQ